MPAAGTKASRKKVRRPGQFHWRGGDQRWRHRALLRQTDRRLGLTQALAQVLPDPRDPGRITHSLLSLLRVASAVVREGQIGGGYGSWQTKDTNRLCHERNSQQPTSSSSATSWTVGASANLGPFDCRTPSGQSPRLQPSPTVWGRWRGPCDWTTTNSSARWLLALRHCPGSQALKIAHPTLKVAQLCPKCLRAKLYLLRTPARLVRIVAQPLFQATVHELERLRCALCGAVFTAPGSATST